MTQILIGRGWRLHLIASWSENNFEFSAQQGQFKTTFSHKHSHHYTDAFFPLFSWLCISLEGNKWSLMPIPYWKGRRKIIIPSFLQLTQISCWKPHRLSIKILCKWHFLQIKIFWFSEKHLIFLEEITKLHYYVWPPILPWNLIWVYPNSNSQDFQYRQSDRANSEKCSCVGQWNCSSTTSIAN